MTALRWIATMFRTQVERRLLPVFLHKDPTIPVTRLGLARLPDRIDLARAVIYSVGVGEDIDFERALVARGARSIWMFDPTPRSIAFMGRQDIDPTVVRFIPVGVWKCDTVLMFHAPGNQAFVSHTVMGSQGGSGGFEATCRSIASLMRELGHTRIDVLKMNVEGAEDSILAAAFEAGVEPGCIILTWEGQWSLAKAVRWTRILRARGYRLAGRVDWYCTYVKP
jgi:FkbM family methyltransferase